MLVCRGNMTMSSANYDTKSQNFCNMTTQKNARQKKCQYETDIFFFFIFKSLIILINIVG